jgi:molybdenum cofactor guanylyltransferase
MKATGIILAGGKNLRYGKNKALDKIGGITLFELVADKLHNVTDDIVVVTAKNTNVLPRLSFARFIEDEYFEKGPLGGIYSGLKAAKYDLGLVVATDMPFLSVPLLNYLINCADGYDVVMPRLKNDMLEALHAVYRKTCLSLIKEQLETGRLQIRPILCKFNIRYVGEDECRRFDPDLNSFFNINRPSDFERAQKIESQSQN